MTTFEIQSILDEELAKFIKEHPEVAAAFDPSTTVDFLETLRIIVNRLQQ